MLKYILRILPAVALTVAYGADPAATFPASDAALPVVGTLRSGIEFAGETVDGDFSALVPLHSTLGSAGKLNGTLIFAEPYGEWVERGSVQAGLGLGFRHLFGDQPLSALRQQAPAGFLDEGIYIGANAFLDMADTRFDQRFWQLGIGAEIGTRYLELRGRYHIPLDNGEEAKARSVTTFQSHYDQNYRGARLVGTSKITIDSLFTFLTEGLEGWDAEASVLVPGLDRWVDLRLTGGYASFHSPTFDALEYDTWKAGVEFRPVPAVVLSGMWFENERLVGDNWLFGISLELPFETANIGDGKGGFWGHIKDAFKPRRRHLAERLSEPARRGALPMQLGTGLTDVKTTVKYQSHAVWILPDGRVITAASASGSYSGTLRMTGGAGYTKSGAGSLTLSSATTYTGATTVNSGTFQLSGTSDVVAGASTGTSAGAFVIIGSSTTPDPGTSTGTTAVPDLVSGATVINGGPIQANIGGAGIQLLGATSQTGSSVDFIIVNGAIVDINSPP